MATTHNPSFHRTTVHTHTLHCVSTSVVCVHSIQLLIQTFNKDNIVFVSFNHFFIQHLYLFIYAYTRTHTRTNANIHVFVCFNWFISLSLSSLPRFHASISWHTSHSTTIFKFFEKIWRSNNNSSHKRHYDNMTQQIRIVVLKCVAWENLVKTSVVFPALNSIDNVFSVLTRIHIRALCPYVLTSAVIFFTVFLETKKNIVHVVTGPNGILKGLVKTKLKIHQNLTSKIHIRFRWKMVYQLEFGGCIRTCYIDLNEERTARMNGKEAYTDTHQRWHWSEHT